MDTKESISKELQELCIQGEKICETLQTDNNSPTDFILRYQSWYTKSLRVVEILALDRYHDFKSYYEINPKRKSLGYGTYVIEDYLQRVGPSSLSYPNFDADDQTAKNVFNQLAILNSLKDCIDSILTNIEIELLSEIQDAELDKARQLAKISLRASGALVGVVIENYLQKLLKKHDIKLPKNNSTIGSLNDLLKKKGKYDVVAWQRVSYLGAIRNTCSHKKDIEPTKDQIKELIDGANWLIKNTF